MKAILPLLILLIAGTTLYMHMNTIKSVDAEFDGESETPDLEQGSLIFRADTNCQIGSRYIMGVGCEETLFLNAHEVKPSTRPINKVQMQHFKVTSSSEANKMTSHKSSISGGGWGVKVKAGLDIMNKNFDSVNSVSVDLTDYRVHNYNFVRASQMELDFGDAQDFEEDPEYFFERNGYYFVIGYTTGSTFDGILNYKSTNKEVLKDVSANVGASYGKGLFSFGGDYAYSSQKHTKNGDAQYDSKLNVTGSNNNVWDKNDISGSHDKFQATMNKDVMLAVAVTKWDSMRDLRESMRNMDADTKAQLRNFGKVNGSFLKKISEAYAMYNLLQSQLSQHIIDIGASLSSKDLQILRQLKTDIDKRIDRVQDLKYIQDITDLNARKYEDDLVEYEFKSVEVEKKLKEITKRID